MSKTYLKGNGILINTISLDYKIIEKIEKILDKHNADYKWVYRKQFERSAKTQEMKE